MDIDKASNIILEEFKLIVGSRTETQKELLTKWTSYKKKSHANNFYVANQELLVIANAYSYITNIQKVYYEGRAITSLLDEEAGEVFIYRPISGFTVLLLSMLDFKVFCYDPFDSSKKLISTVATKLSNCIDSKISKNLIICDNIIKAKKYAAANKLQSILSYGGLELDSDPQSMFEDFYNVSKPGTKLCVIPYKDYPLASPDNYIRYCNYKRTLKRKKLSFRYPEVYVKQ